MWHFSDDARRGSSRSEAGGANICFSRPRDDLCPNWSVLTGTYFLTRTEVWGTLQQPTPVTPDDSLALRVRVMPHASPSTLHSSRPTRFIFCHDSWRWGESRVEWSHGIHVPPWYICIWRHPCTRTQCVYHTGEGGARVRGGVRPGSRRLAVVNAIEIQPTAIAKLQCNTKRAAQIYSPWTCCPK